MTENARETAIDRLMTVINKPDPQTRRVYAEWIVDAILDAAREQARP